MPPLTWKKIDGFPEPFSADRRKNRIIGMTFPRADLNLGLEPSILTVLPDGDNVEYDPENRDYNDADVDVYLCSVYISGMDEFVEWALRHDRGKIVVGGYHPTTFPEDFTRYAWKVVTGLCDEIWETIQQHGDVVPGITRHRRLPRRDLYDARMNQQIIPCKHPGERVMSINTSNGCAMKPPCDFCCTPIMCDRVESKPLELVQREALDVASYCPSYLFIRDENFTMQRDWAERIEVLHKTMPSTKIYLFASANTLSSKVVETLAECGVYMVCLGLEDPTKEYGKNKYLDRAVKRLKHNGVMTYLSFIVDPLEVVGRERGEEFYAALRRRFVELEPEMVCGNFLMPFRGTGLWDRYYQHVAPEDYKLYNSKEPFLVRNPVLREKMKFWMFWHQWSYFKSDLYAKNVRKFETGDTLHLRFTELYERFRPQFERIYDVRA